MRKQHLDLFPLAARSLVGLGLSDVAGHVARTFVDRAQHLAMRLGRAALRLEGAGIAVRFGGAGTIQVVDRRLRLRGASLLPVLSELLAARADVAVALVVAGEVGSLEAPVAA